MEYLLIPREAAPRWWLTAVLDLDQQVDAVHPYQQIPTTVAQRSEGHNAASDLPEHMRNLGMVLVGSGPLPHIAKPMALHITHAVVATTAIASSTNHNSMSQSAVVGASCRMSIMLHLR